MKCVKLCAGWKAGSENLRQKALLSHFEVGLVFLKSIAETKKAAGISGGFFDIYMSFFLKEAFFLPPAAAFWLLCRFFFFLCLTDLRSHNRL